SARQGCTIHRSSQKYGSITGSALSPRAWLSRSVVHQVQSRARVQKRTDTSFDHGRHHDDWITGGNMSGKNTGVFGIYPTQDSADEAVDTLRAKGFRSTDISVLFPQNCGSKEFGHEKGTKSAEGAVAGGGTGAVIGGALGWLAGIGMLAIPGVGPFIAAGPIVATLA